MTNKTIEGPFGARQLSDDDWAAVTGNLYHMNLKRNVEPYKHWDNAHFQFAVKYCLNRCTDWFYFDGTSHFFFGAMEDYVLFKLWVTNNRMIHEQVENSIEVG